MFPLHKDLCEYTIISFKFFLHPPLLAISQEFNLSLIVGLISLVIVPNVALICLTRYGRKYIKLVKHDVKESLDHEHSAKITLDVITRSILLGLIWSIGFKLAYQGPPHLALFGVYIAILSLFHFSEYFVTSLTNISTLSTESFLLNHSEAYVFAIGASFVEYFIEAYYFHSFKRFNVISLLGFMLCLFGEMIRKLAMFTAGENFSHIIRTNKSPDHRLVTHGIYSYLRHPSYAGWMYWAVGTQLLALNPLCTLLFAITSYRFFKDRIEYEEETLVHFFGRDYVNYKRKVPLWMPIQIVCDI